MLGLLEQDYQIVPAADATLNDRRRELAARAKISKGNRQGAMEYALRLLLGADFIEYRTTPIQFATVSPYLPESIGAYPPPGTEKKTIRITQRILERGIPVTVSFETIGLSQLPAAGETYSFDPDTRNASIEAVTVDSVVGANLTATFAKAHEAGAVATNSNPAWISSKRYVSVVTTLAAATNPETRRKINELMARVSRGVTQWEIIHNQGQFVSDDSVLSLSECTEVAA